jgi:hypothetical protein
MNTRQSWIIGAAIVMGCLILSVFSGQRSGADEKPAPKAEPTPVGRYELHRMDGEKGEIIDTNTGRVWRPDDNEWKDLGSPVPQTK